MEKERRHGRGAIANFSSWGKKEQQEKCAFVPENTQGALETCGAEGAAGGEPHTWYPLNNTEDAVTIVHTMGVVTADQRRALTKRVN
jgi:hypothetical protein